MQLSQGASELSNRGCGGLCHSMIAICWHFAYGVWLFAAKWALRRRDGAEAFWLCVRVLGVLLA